MATTVPAGVPAGAIATARDTLAGAMAVAEQLPGPLGSELIAVARVAFTHSMQWTAAISAAVVLATAVASVVLLRHVRPSTPPDRLSARTAIANQILPVPSTAK